MTRSVDDSRRILDIRPVKRPYVANQGRGSPLVGMSQTDGEMGVGGRKESQKMRF